MALVRDLGQTLPALVETIIVTCSAMITTGSTSANLSMTSTADVLIATGGAASSFYTSGFGRIIDRTAPPLGTLYQVALPQTFVQSTVGSTEANRAVGIGVKLQHGDSSGGGDMADYSTQSQPADRVFFGTGRTTDMLSWESGGRSTGTFSGVSNPCSYDLRGAKKYIRAVARVALIGRTATTESTGEERSRVSAAITFLAASDIPNPVDTKSPLSTSTSTV